MNQPIRNKNHLWQTCIFVRLEEMRKLCKGPSLDAPYQIFMNLAKQIQRRRFFNVSANQKQELPFAAQFVDGSGQNVKSL